MADTQPVPLRFRVKVVFALIGVFVLWIVAVKSHGGFPTYPIRWPIFFAPMVTFFVASLALTDFFDHLRVKEASSEQPVLANSKIKVILLVAVTFIVWNLVFIACLLLAFFKGWWEHLLYLLGLFGVFIAWDMAVLYLLRKGDTTHRHQIAWGNRLVNRPTIFALVFALLALTGLMLTGWGDSWTRISHSAIQNGSTTSREAVERQRSEPTTDNQSRKSEPIADENDMTPRDIFVTGLVFFHLMVAAFGYLALYFREKKGNLHKMGHVLFYLTPEGSD